MRHLTMKEIDEKMHAPGIQEYAEWLDKRYPLDPMERKKRRNPVEWEIINELRQKRQGTGEA